MPERREMLTATDHTRAIGKSTEDATAPSEPNSGGRSFRILAVLLWAACTLPTTVLLFQTNRVFSEAIAYTPQTQTLRYLLIAAVAAWALGIISRRASNLGSRPLGALFLFAAAIFFPSVSSYFLGVGSVDEFLTAAVSLLLVLALFVLRITWSQMSVIGSLGALTGAVSLAMAQLRPDSAFSIEEGGRALAGPFNNSNYLGTVLVLSLPFALMIRRRLLRYGTLALCVLPIMMGGSKTGIATLFVFAGLGVVLMLGRSPSFRGSFLKLATTVALMAMVLLPLVVNDPGALTRRGAIWIYARTHPSGYLPFGAGRKWFEENSTSIGYDAPHAHHLLLDPLIVGGLPFAGVVLILLLWLIRSGVRAATHGETVAPALFAVTLVLAGGLGNFFILDLRDLRYTATGFVIVAILSIATRPSAPKTAEGEVGLATAPNMRTSRTDRRRRTSEARAAATPSNT